MTYGYADERVTTQITLDTRVLEEVELSGAVAAISQLGIPPLWYIRKGGSIIGGSVIANGTVYFGALDGILYAVGLDGKERWRFRTNGTFICDPCLDRDVLVMSNTDHHVYAVSLDGRLRWRFAAGDAFAATVVAADGYFVGCKDGTFFALDCDGRLRWRFATHGPIHIAALAHAGCVAFGSWDKNIYCLDSSGRERWRFAAKGMLIAEPALINSTGFFGDSEATVYAIDLPSGGLRWTFSARGNPRSITAAGDLVIVATYDNRLHAVDAATGIERWQAQGTASGNYFVRQAAVHNGAVYAANTDGKLYALSLRDGQLLWTFAARGVTVATPSVHDNRLFFGSYDCTFYCITTDGKLVWAFPTSMSSISTIDTEAYRQEFGEQQQTFVLQAAPVTMEESRYKEARQDGGGPTVYASFSTYVARETYSDKRRRYG